VWCACQVVWGMHGCFWGSGGSVHFGFARGSRKISNEVLGVAFVVGIGVGVGWRADGGGRFTWEVVNGGVLGEGL